MDNAKKSQMWTLCEAFTLTGGAFGHQTVHKSLTPWCIVCKDRKTAMRELRKAVKDRVAENYYGLDDAKANIKRDVREVLAGVDKELRRKKVWQYIYSAEDREVVWRIYPAEVVK